MRDGWHLGSGGCYDEGFQKTFLVSGLLRCQSRYTVMGRVGWLGGTKSGRVSGSGFWACRNLDFGVRVGLGEHIEMTPLSSPGVPDFGFGFRGNYFPESRVGLSVQTLRESGCESRGQVRVQVRRGYEVSGLKSTLQK